MKVNKKWLTVSALLSTLAFSSVAMAFSDIAGDPAKAKIDALRNAGVVAGVGNDQFAPKEKILTAEAVLMIVKGLGLNIDHMRFVKEPKASDYFSRVPDDAWYSDAFVIAHLNGLSLSKDIDPNATLTREQFAVLLNQAIHIKGDFPVIEIFILMEDEEKVDAASMNAVQFLLITKIANLDTSKRFRPDDQATRSEAADMIYEARRFVEDMKKQTDPATEPDGSEPRSHDSSTETSGSTGNGRP